MGPRLSLVRHETNLGVGAAIRTGYRRALADRLDVVAVMGGDGQMDPDDLASLVLPVARGLCDYAKGNRFTSGSRPAGMPLVRYLAIGPLATLTSLASGIRTLRDPQSGYTAISFECLRELPLDLLHPGYGYPNHLLILLGAAGKRVVEVPVRAIYGRGDESGIRPWKVAPTLLALLAKGCLLRLRAERARTEQTCRA
jgi:glycosyltransferase involved in cell wall biosynthesis